MSELRRITERYRLDDRVSLSGASTVFRAADIQSSETVAVKLVNGEGSETEEERERFSELCRALQALQHPSIPRVLDFGFTTAGSPFLVTEYLDGSSLDELSGSAAPTRVLSLLLLVAEGLEAMAKGGLAHRNLQAGNVLLTRGPGGERVKILGLGGVAQWFGDVSSIKDGYRQDLGAFGSLACHLLGLSATVDSQVAIPSAIAAELADAEALRSLLEAALRPDPEQELPDYVEVQRRLRQALPAVAGGNPGSRTVRVPAWGNSTIAAAGAMPEVFNSTVRVESVSDLMSGTIAVPPPVPAAPPKPPPLPFPVTPAAAPVAPPPAAPPVPPPQPRAAVSVPPLPVPRREAGEDTAPVIVPSKRLGKGALLAGGAVLAAVVLVAGLWLWLRSRPAPPPRVAPPPAVTPTPPPVVAEPSPPPEPVVTHPQLQQAEDFLGAGDLKSAKAALDSITPAEQATFQPAELERYQRFSGVLARLQGEALAANLTRGLETGDLRLLRAASDSVPPAGLEALPPAVRRSLSRARKALEADARLARAERAGDSLEVIRQGTALLEELPRAAAAGERRERAADAIESQADTALDAGQYDAAAGLLEGLRSVWPDRQGLVARTDRIAAERKAEQDIDSLLAAAGRSAKANKPQEGLQLLADVKAPRRFADRVQETRQRLEAQLAQLDRRPPEIRTSAELLYEKGKSAAVPLQITDDYGVKTAEGWARAEGGQYVKLPVRHVSGADWVMEVPPDLHQNKTVELYARAVDESGHAGQLGSAEKPIKMKRRTLIDKIRDKLKGDAPPG